jgi:hypothetical protein
MFDLYFIEPSDASPVSPKLFRARLQTKRFSELLDHLRIPSSFSAVAVGVEAGSALARRAIAAEGTELPSEKHLFCFDIESALNPVTGVSRTHSQP